MTTGRWSFPISLLVFNLACALGLYAVLAALEQPFGKVHYAALLYFLLLGAILHTWQERAFISHPQGSVQRYMTGMVIKMLLSLLLIMVLVIKLPKEDVLSFALPFMGLYLAHLAFGTVRLTALLRRTRT
ncbi:MAG: hypothetical protein KF905_04485 [Flavobacteriales bacterium]|nr:hypothetical protein [Flavobacteriales bacterium]